MCILCSRPLTVSEQYSMPLYFHQIFLQFFAQACHRNIQLLAILRYRPAGDVIPFFLQMILEFFIRKGLSFIFVFNDLGRDGADLLEDDRAVGVHQERFGRRVDTQVDRVTTTPVKDFNSSIKSNSKPIILNMQ